MARCPQCDRNGDWNFCPYCACAMVSSAQARTRVPRDKLRRIAVVQKSSIACIVAQFVLLAGAIAVLMGDPKPPAGDLAVCLAVGLMVGVQFTSAALVILQGLTLHGPAFGIVLGVVALATPCTAVVMLVVVNSMASAVLRENGISVGAWGGGLSELTSPPESAEPASYADF